MPARRRERRGQTESVPGNESLARLHSSLLLLLLYPCSSRRSRESLRADPFSPLRCRDAFVRSFEERRPSSSVVTRSLEQVKVAPSRTFVQSVYVEYVCLLLVSLPAVLLRVALRALGLPCARSM